MNKNNSNVVKLTISTKDLYTEDSYAKQSTELKDIGKNNTVDLVIFWNFSLDSILTDLNTIRIREIKSWWSVDSNRESLQPFFPGINRDDMPITHIRDGWFRAGSAFLGSRIWINARGEIPPFLFVGIPGTWNQTTGTLRIWLRAQTPFNTTIWALNQRTFVDDGMPVRINIVNCDGVMCLGNCRRDGIRNICENSIQSCRVSTIQVRNNDGLLIEPFTTDTRLC